MRPSNSTVAVAILCIVAAALVTITRTDAKLEMIRSGGLTIRLIMQLRLFSKICVEIRKLLTLFE